MRSAPLFYINSLRLKNLYVQKKTPQLLESCRGYKERTYDAGFLSQLACHGLALFMNKIQRKYCVPQLLMINNETLNKNLKHKLYG